MKGTYLLKVEGMWEESSSSHSLSYSTYLDFHWIFEDDAH